jgi:aryl-alcohol dehydrogenase-like predicted oxidoreductase
MEYRNLGRSGLQVSAIGLGCNNFGRRVDEQATRAVVDASLDQGITLFDTADMYGPGGLSEEYLGKALQGRRQEVLIATKFAGPMADGSLHRGASRRYIFEAVEASLRRLGTDFIDLYQIHFPDTQTPLAETMRALDDLVRQGKVRYLGCSNFAGWQLVDAQWIARSENRDGFISAQNLYNLLDRRIERELVPACNAHGVGILPYFPLASGFLTGKYRRGHDAPAGTRLSAAGPMADLYLTEANFDQLEALEAFASERGHSMLELAIGWLASQPHVSSVIAGAKSGWSLRRVTASATRQNAPNSEQMRSMDWMLSGSLASPAPPRSERPSRVPENSRRPSRLWSE